MKKYIAATSLVIIAIILSAYKSDVTAKKADIYGHWVRETDGLQMELSPEEDNYEIGSSQILIVGDKEFPCELRKKIIYKNIIQQEDSLWTCDFLVVMPDDCSLKYRLNGKMLLTDIGKLLVVCPGYQPMYYDKKNPRHSR